VRGRGGERLLQGLIVALCRADAEAVLGVAGEPQAVDLVGVRVRVRARVRVRVRARASVRVRDKARDRVRVRVGLRPRV